MSDRRDPDVVIHTLLTILWIVLAVPTLLWWRESILWVAFMSLYANVAGHWSAREAAQAKRAAETGSHDDTPSDG